MSERRDEEANRLTGRVARYARVGTNVGAVAARLASAQLLGRSRDDASNARLFREALGNLRGPLMKLAQMLSTIPDALPAEYAIELAQLQSNAPPMGWPFVRRRMAAELGPDWLSRFATFEREAAAAASLGQVHRASTKEGELVACKLQYPEMQSAVEADLQQLKFILALHRRMDPAIDTTEIGEEIAARLREELDYRREAKNIALYAEMLAPYPTIRVPKVHDTLSTRRLLTMTWLEGKPILYFTQHSLAARNLLGRHLFDAWWQPFCHYGAIHGDPHLGNYTAVVDAKDQPQGLNLLDYGCIRLFHPRFVAGVVDLYHGLMANDRDRIVHAYETWGFVGLSNELIEALNIWARFIYGPLMEDRVRPIAEGVAPGQYGRREAFAVHRTLKERGPVKVPREFVFMDRAAIGLGSVLIHLRAELNFHQLFKGAIERFRLEDVAKRQAAAFTRAGIDVPAA
ncbi:ABC1 kinase family protein [Rhodoligotrophos defluvii]|uniref:ABC1 kinase family protein n=1 Tax=Rhodoligotrophos defluvii TaxID=2561934 RepID=UPI0010CA051B|nr:AarF/ABC1/UbiB kinase family protein [Rhodoligotrophos defluvii]